MEPSDESTPPDDVPESEVARRRNANMVYGIVAGMLLGVVVGVVLGNMALWIAIGVGVGVAVGSGVDIESMLGWRPKKQRAGAPRLGSVRTWTRGPRHVVRPGQVNSDSRDNVARVSVRPRARSDRRRH